MAELGAGSSENRIACRSDHNVVKRIEDALLMNQKPHLFTRLTKTKRRAVRHDPRTVELMRRRRQRCLRQIGLSFVEES